MSLIAVDRLDVRHGLLQAVREVSFAIDEGEIVALVGANGAGKSTLLRAIAGAHFPSSGGIVFDGADVTSMRAHNRVAQGIALVPEGRRLFGSLTVEENLRVAMRVGRRGDWTLDRVMELFPMLRARRDTLAGNLSGGERQAAAIGRALMTNPRLILLDEVSLGLAPVVIEQLYRSMRSLLQGGATLVLVEQELTRALSVATRVMCMLEGRIVLDGPVAAVSRDQIVDAYFGLHRAAPGARVNVVNLVAQGVLLGGYYALLACGLSLMFGVMRIINLAHGDLAILAAFLVLSTSDYLEISPFLSLAAVLPVMAAVGWLLQRGILERSLRSGMLVPLLATFGLSIALENLLFEAYGADTRSLGDMIGDLAFDSYEVSSQFSISYLAALIFALAVALLGGLSLFLKRTSLGRAIRATAEDPDAAELVGVNSRAVYAVAAAIAVATVALAGTMLAMRATFDPYSGPMQLIFAFEAVVIGGIGSLWGTLVGGIVLGLAQSIGATFDPKWFLLAGHLTFLAVLGLRLFRDWSRARGGVLASLGLRG